jgi:hypothetical protein
MTKEEFEKLKPFNLTEACAGVPYVHQFDCNSGYPRYNDVRIIAPPNPTFLIWVGEWIAQEADDPAFMYMRMAPNEEHDNTEEDQSPHRALSPDQLAARRAFVERFFSNAPDFQQRLAMLDAEAK